MSSVLVESVPSWKFFVFGGVVDENRSLGQFDDRVAVLDLGPTPYWSEPTVKSKRYQAGTGNEGTVNVRSR
jgi:hypothetical protein